MAAIAFLWMVRVPVVRDLRYSSGLAHALHELAPTLT